MKLSSMAALAATASLLFGASVADAAITVTLGAPSSLPDVFTNFSTLGLTNAGFYSNGGIDTRAISSGTLASDEIGNNRASATNPSWTFKNGFGNTRFTLTDPSTAFTELHFDVGQWSTGIAEIDLFFRVLDTDLTTVLATGKITNLPFQTFETLTVTDTGGHFGAFELSANTASAQSSFDATASRTNLATLDNVGGKVVKLASAVPEPETWAMMLIGFAGLGAVLRHKRTFQRFAN